MTLVPTIPGLIVREAATTSELLAARRLHAQCYVESGYVEAAELVHGLIEDPWVPFSTYVVAIDADEDEIVGTARIIRPSVRGFPAFEFFTPTDDALEIFADLDPNRCSEISALATPRSGFQNMAISAAIYGFVWREAVENERAYMLAIMDDRLFRILRRWFHFPFEAIGEPRHWMGARTTPAAMYIPRTITELGTDHPDMLAYFSGDLMFSELDQVSIDIRSDIAEHRSVVIDLRTESAPIS